jgi:bifunctional DNase/RNase
MQEASVIEMELVGVRVELPANQPIVLLKEKTGTRYLPIWIGAVEATAIAFALQGVDTPRPLTHDLFVDVMGEVGVDLEAVHVTELRDGTFYAELHLSQEGERYTVSARPSDAIALASRFHDVPIFGAEDVLEEAGLEIETRAEDGTEVDPDEEVRQFREFLDNITPEDFREQ